MKKIPLTQNKYVIIDDEDYEWFSQYKWFAVRNKNTFYVIRHITIQSGNKSKNIKRKRETIYLHREIIGKSLKIDEEIHHINDNGLDNRKKNLIIVTRSQHIHTRKKRKGCISQYKGVSWSKGNQKWHAQIKISKRSLHLGYYNCEAEAAKAYDEAAIKYFGEFAYLNKV